MYDCSAATTDREHSLNDCLLTGPNYIPEIFEMLVKFRVNPVGLVAGIEKAFLMVGISEKDRDMLRFLWFKNIENHDPELVQLRFCRLVFRLRPSPATLGATINYHLDTRQENDPEIVEHLRESLYVDDPVSGAQNDEKAFQIYEESKEIIMSTGGFNLRKWHSNSTSLMQSINISEEKVVSSSSEIKAGIIEEDLSYAKESITRESTPTKKTQNKVLGNIWDTATDMLLFNFNELIEYAKSSPATKRSFLKWFSKIFNPLGLLMPFTIKLTMKFQELCLAKINWDEKADEKLCVTMNNLISELAFVNNVPVSRCYFLTNLKPFVAQIHGFSDASERVFAAAVYFELFTRTELSTLI